jgi:hypothetical protein
MKTKLSEYVKVAEAAEILRVAHGTVRAWAEAGKIPIHNAMNQKTPPESYIDLIYFKRFGVTTSFVCKHSVGKLQAKGME